ncbi:MAG: M48 family metalloprotease [Elusimicrobia bacterium]|nr:M48 family metalloprotease [Elusimicrobiota bacterium]
MDCPACAGKPLTQRMGPHGVIVDFCAACSGVWFDKGEVYHYVKDPKRLYEDYAKAYKNTSPSNRTCPRCAVAMVQAQFPPPGPLIDACAKCGGNWFDGGEVQAVQAMLDKEMAGSGAPAAVVAAPPAAQTPSFARTAAAAAGLAALPSLAFRSVVVLGALYAVLAGFCAIVVWKLELPLDFIFIGSAASLLISFVIGPWFTDLSLSWLHAFHWANPEDLPAPLRQFINQACQAQGVPFPRVGILEDGNPNAFTYGHVPSNARLVLTQGVLDMLEEKELQAVVGHEIGHIVHWDMLVMTVAALVPLVLYTIYKVCSRVKAKKNNPFPLIAFVAWILYLLTEYTVLFLSRTRELYADRFSGELTHDPNSLSSALVKIAYGLAGHRSEDAKGEESATHETVRALGIFDPIGAMGLVAASLSRSGAPSKENILGAMQWDLWNPWAKYYELQSTHPLPAHRLELLGQQAAAYGQTPFVNFDLKQPESYWDEFAVDFLMLWLPWLLAGLSLASDSFWGVSGPHVFWSAAGGWAIGNLGKLWFSYRTGFYPDMTVAAALKKVKVSGVRGIPAALKGTIIGRGVPGYIISEDMVLQDETGFLFLDYKQPLALFQWIFAITRVPALIGREMSVIGWYRRAPVPYLELRSFVCDGKTSTCYSLEAQYAFSILLLAAGTAGMLGFF